MYLNYRGLAFLISLSFTLLPCMIQPVFSQEDHLYLEMSFAIKKDKKPLEGAEITVYKGSEFFKTITTNKTGRFTVQLPLNGDFLVVVSRAGCISKKLSVETKVPGRKEDKDIVWIYPTVGAYTMELYEKVEAVAGGEILDKPVAKINFNDDFGDFDFDTKYAQDLKAEISRLSAEAKKKLIEEAEKKAREAQVEAKREALGILNDVAEQKAKKADERLVSENELKAMLQSKELAYAHIDTAAMYRAIALYLGRNHQEGSISSPDLLARQLENIHITFKMNPETGKLDLFLNGENVQDDLNSMTPALLDLAKKLASSEDVREKVKEVREKAVAEYAARLASDSALLMPEKIFKPAPDTLAAGKEKRSDSPADKDTLPPPGKIQKPEVYSEGETEEINTFFSSLHLLRKEANSAAKERIKKDEFPEKHTVTNHEIKFGAIGENHVTRMLSAILEVENSRTKK